MKSAKFTTLRFLESIISTFYSNVVRLPRMSNFDNVKLCQNAQNLFVHIHVDLGHKLTNVILIIKTILLMRFSSR